MTPENEEALKLADDALPQCPYNEAETMKAAEHIRRLVAENERLKTPLTEEQKGEIGEAAARFNWFDDYVEAVDFVIERTEAAHGIGEKT